MIQHDFCPIVLSVVDATFVFDLFVFVLTNTNFDLYSAVGVCTAVTDVSTASGHSSTIRFITKPTNERTSVKLPPSIQRPCTQIEARQASCLNGGQCMSGGRRGVICSCSSLYSGNKCQIPTRQCPPNYRRRSQQHQAAAPTAKPQNTQCKNIEQTSTGRDAKGTRNVNAQNRKIKHKGLHINQRDQWATVADLGRPSATKITEGVVILDYVRTTLYFSDYPEVSKNVQLWWCKTTSSLSDDHTQTRRQNAGPNQHTDENVNGYQKRAYVIQSVLCRRELMYVITRGVRLTFREDRWSGPCLLKRGLDRACHGVPSSQSVRVQVLRMRLYKTVDWSSSKPSVRLVTLGSYPRYKRRLMILTHFR
ncbi:hypothetical protein FSP39_010324 [Pinctada imbricata]|uniref:EGF-like domain-containing protein n=1 Tax=Pinctada imbricata TaxID=66713 RepID=A0AA88YA64_PINIB|nr:hypothetical protein FSP39_010324 [Pinctada imbricata]